MADAHNDRWLDLIERFAGRGARIRVGNLQPDMVTHLLDTIEEQDSRIRGLEDAVRKLRGERAVTEAPAAPRIGEIKPDGD